MDFRGEGKKSAQVIFFIWFEMARKYDNKKVMQFVNTNVQPGMKWQDIIKKPEFLQVFEIAPFFKTPGAIGAALNYAQEVVKTDQAQYINSLLFSEKYLKEVFSDLFYNCKALLSNLDGLDIPDTVKKNMIHDEDMPWGTIVKNKDNEYPELSYIVLKDNNDQLLFM